MFRGAFGSKRVMCSQPDCALFWDEHFEPRDTAVAHAIGYRWWVLTADHAPSAIVKPESYMQVSVHVKESTMEQPVPSDRGAASYLAGCLIVSCVPLAFALAAALP